MAPTTPDPSRPDGGTPAPSPEPRFRLHPALGDPPAVVAMVAFPGMTPLDLIGPHSILATAAQVHLVAKTMDPVLGDSGAAVVPTCTLDECPEDLDVLFIGGGGTAAVVQDRQTVEFLADRGSRARYVTSVGSGSLVLGAAGLLRGCRATSHWASSHLLPLFGAIPVDQRVVIDRNRISGGGLTAGIDFGLVLLAEMFGDDVAKLTQLAFRYDPAPPFQAGSPRLAGPEIVGTFHRRRQGGAEVLAAALARAAELMPA